MAGTAIVAEIVQILTAGLTQMATGIGQGISALVSNVLFTGSGETQTLSAFAIVTFVFAGISLTIGLSKYIVKLIGSFGARK